MLPEPRLAPPDHWSQIATTDPVDRARHTYGRSYRDQVRGLRGDFSPAPDFVVRPRSEDEVAEVLRWAADRGAAVVPYGGGTSVVAGVECDGVGRAGVVCLDTTAMARVLEIDAVSLSARIEAGATGPAIEAALAVHGLTLRHYPQSFEFSTLGGWIATRAGGHFATVYTHIDDLVQSVRMVTPRGTWASARVPASGAGPSPDRLVLGSEGILGVITQAWMRVRPRPNRRARASVRFGSWDDAVEVVRAIAQARLYPANCRLLDKNEAMVNLVPAQGGHVLILGFESADRPVAPALAEALALADAHGGAVLDQGEGGAGGRWRDAFLQAPYLWSALTTMGVMLDTFETAITWERYPALHADVMQTVGDTLRDRCGQGMLTCRFSHVYPDGPAPYYTFIAPSAPGEEEDRWWAVKRAAADVLARHGATITHHHAVGRTHRPWYDAQRPDLFADALRAAKRAVDPDGMLNPGVLIDP